MSGRHLHKHPAPGADHAGFHRFLADAGGEALPALRHLLACPLCERLARLLLFGFPPAGAPLGGQRRRRAGGADRSSIRGEGV